MMLPLNGVFDNLLYNVSTDGTVTLLGEVSRPPLKSDAERAVMNSKVSSGSIIRSKCYPYRPTMTAFGWRRIARSYGNSVLSQYPLRAVPPIHIIVENGHVTLEGAVARQMEKQVAEMQANRDSGVFSVANNSRVEND